MWTNGSNHISLAVSTANSANFLAAVAIKAQRQGSPHAHQLRRDAAILRRLVGWYADPRWKEAH